MHLNMHFLSQGEQEEENWQAGCRLCEHQAHHQRRAVTDKLIHNPSFHWHIFASGITNCPSLPGTELGSPSMGLCFKIRKASGKKPRRRWITQKLCKCPQPPALQCTWSHAEFYLPLSNLYLSLYGPDQVDDMHRSTLPGQALRIAQL